MYAIHKSLKTVMQNPSLKTLDIALIKSPFRRLVPSLYRRISKFSSTRYYVKRRYGLLFLLDRGSLIDRSMLYTFGWEGEKYRQFIEFCREKLFNSDEHVERVIFLDVGAHWGLYAIRASQETYIDQIYCFEPDKRTIPQLYANIYLNHLRGRIEVVEKAVTSHDGYCFFEASPDSNRGASRTCSEDISGSEPVECCRLDSLISVSKSLIIMKIDVEGGELDALKGMEGLIGRNKVILMVERHHDVASLVEYLNSIGVKYVGEVTDAKGETDYLFSSCDS